MFTCLRALNLAAGVAVLAAGSLHGQASDRPTFWAAIGAGAGPGRGMCDNCAGIPRATGMSVFGRAGVMVARGIGVGIEGVRWGRTQDNVEQSVTFGSAVLLIHPASVGAFLKVGIGALYYFSQSTTTLDIVDFTAPGASLGLGYEVRVTRHIAITPFGNVLLSAPVKPQRNGGPFPTNETMRSSVVQLGAGVTWRS